MIVSVILQIKNVNYGLLQILKTAINFIVIKCSSQKIKKKLF